MALTAEQLELLNGDFSGEVDPSLDKTASRVNNNLVRAADGNPDQYAEDRKLGQDLNLNTDLVARNRDKVKRMKYLDELDLQALDETPVTQEWLKNDENTKIAWDDVAVLQKFERENARTWYQAGSKAFENFGKTSLLGLGKAWDGIALSFLNDAKYGQGPGSQASMDAIMENADFTPEQRANQAKWTAETGARLDKNIDERTANIAKAEKEIGKLTPKGMTEMEEGIRGAMQVGIDVAPGMIVSALTRGRVNPTLALMGGKVYGDSYATAIAEGKSHEVAKRYAAIDSVIEIATERFPMKRLERVVGDLGGNTPKSWVKKFMLEELTTEQMATSGQTINAYIFDLDEELANAKGWKEVMDIQMRRQAVTLIATTLGGGTIAGTVKGVDYLASREQRAMGKLVSDTNKRRGSEFDQKRLDNLISLSQSSKVNERAADAFEDLVSKMDPDQQIFMDAEAVELLDDPPDYLIKQMDGSGGTVSMPLSTFLKDFANDEKLMAIVRPFIKTDERHQNQTEAEQEDDSDYIKSILTKAAETQETKSTADAIYEQVTEQLIATGQLSAASARQAATLVPAQVTVQYEHLKNSGYKNEDGSEVTLEQVFATIGLEIVGPQVDVAADFMTQAETPEYEEAVARGEAGGYPMAPRDDWSADADFAARGGQVAQMTPDEFLDSATPLTIDEEARENIDDLKRHIQEGGELDPLAIYGDKSLVRNSDGRHRAIAAKELGLDEVPVLDFRDADTNLLAQQQEVAQQDDTLMQIVEGDSVTLEDGRTYEKQKTDPDHRMVLVDAGLLAELWVDQVGPGPTYTNQISNRIEQYKQFLERHDRGVHIMPDGREIPMPKENIQVGNAYVKGPTTGYSGYISFGDGRHRARVMLEQGLQRIPISMDAESVEALGAIVAAREAGGILPGPRVLAQQNLSTIELVEDRVDLAGNVLTITENAGVLWQEQQTRKDNINKLRNCLRA